MKKLFGKAFLCKGGLFFMRTKFTPQTLAIAGVLVAMNIVLSKFIAIPIGDSLRITVSSVPIILAGIWLGPLAGGCCGFLGDFLGCLVSGYAPNPFISVSAILMGVLPALLLKLFRVRGGKTTENKAAAFAFMYLRFLAAIALTMLVTSQGITTYGLAVMYGRPFGAQWLLRLPQSVLLVFVNSLLTCLLYTRIPQRLFRVQMT